MRKIMHYNTGYTVTGIDHHKPMTIQEIEKQYGKDNLEMWDCRKNKWVKYNRGAFENE